ncbi:MAG: F0F1 ATP synthase subunit A [Gemmatimonadota bacterium]
MTTFLRVLQEAGQHGAEAAEHAVETVQHGAEEVAGTGPDVGGMLMHHLADAHEIELPWGVWHLPQWEPIHFGGLTIDLSPTKHVVFMLLAAVIVCVVFLAMARAMRGKYAGRAPGGMANALEAIILYFRDEIVRRNIGHGADGYTPFILTLFFFILTMNLLGLVPWGASPTGNIMVTGALAVCSLVAIEVSGFVALGPSGYAKTIFYAPKGMGPVGTAIMLVIMTPVELVGKIAKPFALMVRLFANMTAGHTVILSLIGLIFVFGNLTIGRWGIAVGSVGMSVAMMMLEIFVAFLQAYIFAMLTSVFIGLIRHAH